MDPAQASPRALDVPEFVDGLGERTLATDATSGDAVEVMNLRSALISVPSFEFALRERTARLANFRQNAFARVRRVDRTPTGLSVVSDHVPGFRLSQMLQIAEERRLVVDTNAALSLISQLLPAIALLHENARDVAHGAIGPDRLIITPHARLVVAEYVLGSALEQLQLSHDRLWRDYRIPMPPSAGAPRFDHRADVMQIGVTSLSLILGRMLRHDEFADINGLLAGSTETSAGGARQPLSQGLRGWLARALQLDPRRPFLTAREAQVALEQVLSADPRHVASTVAVEAFLSRCVDSIIDLDAPAAAAPAAAPPVATPPAPAPPTVPVPRAETQAPPAPRVETPFPPVPRTEVPPAPIPRVDTPVAPPAARVEPPVAPVAPPVPRVEVPVAPSAPHVSAPRVEPPVASVPPVVRREAPVAPSSPVIAQPVAPAARVEPPTGTTIPVEPLAAPVAKVQPPAIDLESLHSFGSASGSLFAEEPEEPETRRGAGGRGGRSWLRPVAILVAVAAIGTAGVVGARWYLAQPAATANETGAVVVQSAPGGVEVFVDGVTRGVTPLRISLKPGPHILELRGKGLPRVIPITVTAGTTLSQFVEFAEAAVPSSGQLDVRSDPPGAKVLVDGQAVGAAPMLVQNLAPGEHTVVLEREGNTVRHTVRIEAGATASLVAPLAAAPTGPASGWVSIGAPFAMQIFEEGRLIGSTETDRIMVSAGRHEFELVNETLGYRVTRVVQVQPGRVATVGIELPNGLVNVNAMPWAEVWIDNQRVGETPIGNLSLPIGPHEVVFRHPQFGEKRQAISVTPATPVRVSVDMRK